MDEVSQDFLRAPRGGCAESEHIPLSGPAGGSTVLVKRPFVPHTGSRGGPAAAPTIPSLAARYSDSCVTEPELYVERGPSGNLKLIVDINPERSGHLYYQCLVRVDYPIEFAACQPMYKDRRDGEGLAV